jgi:hypothetical protein
MISGQCENLMIFKHFDGFSWYLGNVKISWFLNTLTVFMISGKISRFLNILTYFHDFWAMWKSHDFWIFWHIFMISGQCKNLMIFKHFDGFSWFLGNPGQCENLMILKHWRFFMISEQCENLMIFKLLTVFHDFWAMWKSHCFHYF